MIDKLPKQHKIDESCAEVFSHAESATRERMGMHEILHYTN